MTTATTDKWIYCKKCKTNHRRTKGVKVQHGK
jgi:hypothetical protein